MKLLRAFAPAVVLGCFLLSANAANGQVEASRVRILLVLDTLDRMGATWGLDGDNMQALFDHAFGKQGLVKGKHYTIDMLTGNKVTPKQVLEYYRNLKVQENEALVFYYSGHGGYHGKKGHFMALTLGHQQLYRNDILQAMDAKKPRLKVILTDCCANLTGGAWNGVEPKGSVVQPLEQPGGPGGKRAVRQEPAAKVVTRGNFKPIVPKDPPRPNIPVRKLSRAKIEEPPSAVENRASDTPSKRKKAARAEPNVMVGKYVLLRTPTGAVPYPDLLTKVDGKIIRHLFFEHKGVVDINGCPKGLVSQGTIQWGGSLFTLAFLQLQAEDFNKLDADGNGFVEWREIFTPWVSLTERINRGLSKGNPRAYVQTPEAWQLNASK